MKHYIIVEFKNNYNYKYEINNIKIYLMKLKNKKIFSCIE